MIRITEKMRLFQTGTRFQCWAPVFCAVFIGLSTATAQDEEEAEEKPAIEKTTTQKLGEFLERASEEETKRRMDKVATRIDEMAIVCELSEAQTKKLKLASKGAVEGSLEDWREWIQSYANSRIQQAGENIDAALEQVAGVRYGGDQISRILESDLWKKTLSEQLTPEQLEKLEGAESRRIAFRQKSVTAFIVSNLDFHLRFSEKQRNAIGPLVLLSVEKYLEKLIERTGGEFPQYQSLSLLGGVDEEAAKKVLSDVQWDTWEALFKEHGGWWDGLER